MFRPLELSTILVLNRSSAPSWVASALQRTNTFPVIIVRFDKNKKYKKKQFADFLMMDDGCLKIVTSFQVK